ncbi:hypothetical protein Bbelb_130370 [Branchiostoma belcheri]|nr:hypothetical protein Bbelb_130370 [Branchiostoma belcheri]
MAGKSNKRMMRPQMIFAGKTTACDMEPYLASNTALSEGVPTGVPPGFVRIPDDKTRDARSNHSAVEVPSGEMIGPIDRSYIHKFVMHGGERVFLGQDETKAAAARTSGGFMSPIFRHKWS